MLSETSLLSNDSVFLDDDAKDKAPNKSTDPGANTTKPTLDQINDICQFQRELFEEEDVRPTLVRIEDMPHLIATAISPSMM